jgi:hypothetical protein
LWRLGNNLLVQLFRSHQFPGFNITFRLAQQRANSWGIV